MKAKLWTALSLALIVAMLVTGLALASDVNVSSVVDVTAPTGSVTLAPGGSGAITINMSVTGKQEGTATFEVYRDWTLSSGSFTGSNPVEFTVAPRAATDPANTFSTSGSVSVDSGQGAGTFTLTVSVFDITNTNATGAKLGAGSSASYQVVVEVPAPPTDTTPPTISCDVLDQSIWYASDVTVPCTASDDGSGLADPGDASFSLTTSVADGTETYSAQTDSREVCDNDGNCDTAGPYTFMVDKKGPTVVCDAPAPVFILNQPGALVTATATDEGSGPTTQSVSAAADTSSVGGNKSVEVSASDGVGNTGSAACSYGVFYNFSGFFQPIDMAVVNSAKAGQAIPVKYRLTDYNGTPISDPAHFVSLTSTSSGACSAAADAIETYTGSSGLQYLGDGYWQYNWKTPKTYAGQCRTMSLNLFDGSSHTADFLFK